MSKAPELRGLADSIREQLGLVLGDAEQVREDCRRVEELLASPPGPREMKFLQDLAGFLQENDNSNAQPVCDLLVSIIRDQEAPWPLAPTQ